ncbi:MAG: hypothetical protein ABJD11_02595 [Gemmatimonadota bacterium]
MSIQGPSAAARLASLAVRAPASPSAADARSASSRSTQAAGLSSVLTDEERDFFAQLATLGPVTYGRSRIAAQPAAPRGQRLDVMG